MKLYLASGSPRRRELMKRCGLSFERLSVDVDESYEKGKPEEIVKMLSRRKADAAKFLFLGDNSEDRIIICADTMVASGAEILGKPKDREDAKRMIRLIAGKKHQVHTGVSLVKMLNGEVTDSITFCETTDVAVKAMSEEDIEEYLSAGIEDGLADVAKGCHFEWEDKAGAYAIQGYFSKYIEGFYGDYDNVVGLPVKRLCEELRRMGEAVPMPIHMVVSDIDGTLVKESSGEIYPEMIDAIRELKKKGILFCIATGRQYYSVRHMFREVEDDIIYLCENGAHVVYHGQNLHIKEMKEEVVRELLQELRGFYGEQKIVISTPEGSYLEEPGEEFEELIRNGYHNKYCVTEDFLNEKKPCIKMAIYRKGSIRELGEGYFVPRWSQSLKCCMAGEEWVDFMDASVDKGEALEFLQKYFNISREETMVFGDNSNDLGLVQAAEESYAVENARPELLEIAKYVCPGYEKKGVYQIIKERLLDAE